jgi:hypothetical protein
MVPLKAKPTVHAGTVYAAPPGGSLKRPQGEAAPGYKKLSSRGIVESGGE